MRFGYKNIFSECFYKWKGDNY